MSSATNRVRNVILIFFVVGNIEVFQATPNLVNLNLRLCKTIEGKLLERSFATSISEMFLENFLW